MLFSDAYKMPVNESTGSYKDRGSKFEAYAFPVLTEEEVRAHIQQIRKEHPAAAHHCYAYVLGAGQQVQKSNDDREPSGTAGRPILRAIVSTQLTNTLVVVVRYFGGKLLGVPGLIEAYGGAASEAVKGLEVTEKFVMERHRLTCAPETENEAFKLVKQFGLKIVTHEHHPQITLIFDVRKSMAPQVLKAIQDKRLFETTFLGEQ